MRVGLSWKWRWAVQPAQRGGDGRQRKCLRYGEVWQSPHPEIRTGRNPHEPHELGAREESLSLTSHYRWMVRASRRGKQLEERGHGRRENQLRPGIEIPAHPDDV